MADTLSELKKDIIVESNYLGDVTEEVIEQIDNHIMNSQLINELGIQYLPKDLIDDLNEQLDFYNIYVNPSYE